MSRWRISQIVKGGFILLFAGFWTVDAYAATGDNLDATVKLSSLFLAVASIANVIITQRHGPAWPNEKGRRLAQIASWTLIGIHLLNVVLGSLGVLQITFLAQSSDPASDLLQRCPRRCRRRFRRRVPRAVNNRHIMQYALG